MATHVVRKGSLYRTGVVLKTKTKLYFYRMWCGISYFQMYYSIPNPIPLPFHDIIWIWKAVKLCTSIQTPNLLVWIIFWINILPPSSDSLLKMQAKYSSEALLPRPHVILTRLWFFTTVKTWSKELRNITGNSVDGSCWENWMTSTALFSLPTQYLTLR
jgi:hypothetical protein